MLSKRSLLKPYQDIVSFGKISEIGGEDNQSNLSKKRDATSRQSSKQLGSKRHLIRGLGFSGDDY